MKQFGFFTSISLLSAALVACSLGYAQEPQDKHPGKPQDHDKGQQKDQQDHGQQKQPEQRQPQQDRNNQPRPPQQDRNNQQQQPRQQQDRRDQQGARQHEQQDQNRQQQADRPQRDQGRQQQDQFRQQRGQQMQRTQQQQREQQVQQRQVWQQRRSNHWDTDHRSWGQRGGYNGYRIPDNDFRGHYGHGHPFRIYNLPFMYQGEFPRFQYSGYWFTVMDPYPDYWGNNWYESDDVYVDYSNDGYYLFNRRYPGRPGVAISISF